jgi:hypothetical protein
MLGSYMRPTQPRCFITVVTNALAVVAKKCGGVASAPYRRLPEH